MRERPPIRELETQGELRACVELQEAVWGPGFSERAPVSILKVARRLGGVVAGAVDAEGVLQAFVFGLTGVEEDRTVHWSDMLAVRPALRDRGLGTALKRYQRERCLERGVTRMYWTYDPLEARNGRVNLGKLGAISREYVRDMYGPGDSPLHRGLGTDRLVVLWLLESPRVEARLAGRDPLPGPGDVAGVPQAFGVVRDEPAGTGRGRAGLPRPSGDAGPPPTPGAARLVPVPARIQDVKRAEPEAAVAWREAVREAIERGLAEGLEVTELIRGEEDVSHLLMTPRTDAGAPGASAGDGGGEP